MTYGELLQKLQDLNEEQLTQNVTVLSGGEFEPIHELKFETVTDVLDIGHPILIGEN